VSHVKAIMKVEGNMKIAAWPVIGLVIGTVLGLVWHPIEPSLALYFWPALGAVIVAQHPYRSNQAKKDSTKPPTTRDSE
jgi:hypothetical protein